MKPVDVVGGILWGVLLVAGLAAATGAGPYVEANVSPVMGNVDVKDAHWRDDGRFSWTTSFCRLRTAPEFKGVVWVWQSDGASHPIVGVEALNPGGATIPHQSLPAGCFEVTFAAALPPNASFVGGEINGLARYRSHLLWTVTHEFGTVIVPPTVAAEATP